MEPEPGLPGPLRSTTSTLHGVLSCLSPRCILAVAALLDLNPAYQRVVDDRSEGNHVVAGGARIFRELLDDCLVLRSRRRKDVKVGQHLCPVNTYIEGP